MKILVLSDSHRVSSNVIKAIEKESPDYLIHLGDIEDDTEYIARKAGAPKVPCIFIRGNCDYSSNELWQKAVFNLKGHRFYCAHGHKERVNYGLATLALSAQEEGCDIAIFGHTHIPYDSFAEALPIHNYYGDDNFRSFAPNLRILNPGSIAIPRGGSQKGYMLIDMQDSGAYTVTYKTI
ncbi:MAG: metallophosphoesterase [Saccharofermentans sp.]|nr:metallophosphoesterase [Saccharofermentans sp.]